MKLAFVFLIVLLLLLEPVKASSSWSQNQESVPSGSQYSPGKEYDFQINWNADENHTVSNVMFESNFSGSLSNITTYNSSDTYSVNFTGLPAGSYGYRWYLMDNESNWNSTDQFDYVVIKNSSFTIKLYLSGSQSNKEYNLYDVANFTASLALPGRTVYLDSNFSGISQSGPNSVATSLINLTSGGFFSVTAYWNGDENYSGSSQTYYFDDLPPRYISRSEYPLNPTNYSPYAFYTFGSTWFDLNIRSVVFESNFSGSLRDYSISTTPNIQNNSNSYFYIEIGYLPAETINYRWIAYDSSNKKSNSTQYNYSILKGMPLSLDVLPANRVLLGTETTVICLSSTNQVQASNFKLFRNDTLIKNDTTQSSEDKKFWGEGAYEYVCNSTETQNFTSQTIAAVLSVVTNLSEEIEPLSLNVPSSTQTYAGGTTETTMTLSNNLNYSVSNITISLTGLDSSWYNFSELPASIPTDFSLPINLNISVPSDAEQKNYSLTITARVKTPSGFVSATKTLTLTVEPQPQPENFPPVYSDGQNLKTENGYEFSLRWDDDKGLSGYIFSSNISGTRENDSFIPTSGTEIIVNVTKNISLSAGQTISWKVYAEDTNNLWTESQEFYLTATENTPSMVIPIIVVSVFVVGLASLLLFLTRAKSKKAPEKENKVYVYRKDDVK